MRQETPGVTTVAIIHYKVKGVLSSLRQFLVTESPLFHLKSSFRSQDI